MELVTQECAETLPSKLKISVIKSGKVQFGKLRNRTLLSRPVWCALMRRVNICSHLHRNIQRDEEELKIAGRSNFDSARSLPLPASHSSRTSEQHRFYILIPSTLKPWGAGWTSAPQLSWASCHSIIKHTGRTSPNASANQWSRRHMQTHKRCINISLRKHTL